MIAAGLDIGGTKIETQVFDRDWKQVAQTRVATPDAYADLVAAVADQIAWAQGCAGGNIPVGIGAAGLMHPHTGLVLTANLAASGKPFPADIAQAANTKVTFLNDCRALALSEAVFGAGKGKKVVMSVILGTGIGGGIAVNARLKQGPTGLGGEFGHIAAPADVVAHYDLPIWACGCGRKGCIETYLAGPGLQRLALHVTGQHKTPEHIAQDRTGAMAQVWDIWCALAGGFFHTLTLIEDPDVIVLGGGLSKIEGIAADLMQATQAVQLEDFDTPPIVLASGGDTSGARGAAYAAHVEQAPSAGLASEI